MRDENTILQEEADAVREIQHSIRRALTDDRSPRKKALKVVSSDSGIGYSTLLTYFPEEGSNKKPQALPVAALRLLLKAIHPDVVSLLLPDGFSIIRNPQGIDHDELAEAVGDYLAAKHAAHHPDSPAGRDIADCERKTLDAKVVHLPLQGKVA